jgi:hypothetical protein
MAMPHAVMLARNGPGGHGAGALALDQPSCTQHGALWVPTWRAAGAAHILASKSGFTQGDPS